MYEVPEVPLAPRSSREMPPWRTRARPGSRRGHPERSAGQRGAEPREGTRRRWTDGRGNGSLRAVYATPRRRHPHGHTAVPADQRRLTLHSSHPGEPQRREAFEREVSGRSDGETPAAVQLRTASPRCRPANLCGPRARRLYERVSWLPTSYFPSWSARESRSPCSRRESSSKKYRRTAGRLLRCEACSTSQFGKLRPSATERKTAIWPRVTGLSGQ